MTKKDFDLIAKVLKSNKDKVCEVEFKNLVIDFANELRWTNEQFKFDLFYKACGGIE